MDRLSDEQLLRRAREDPVAFGEFYARHERDVLTFLVRQTHDPEVAADLCAETFAQVLLSLERFRPERGDARGWLFGIARHQVGRHRRRGRVELRARRQLGLLDLRYDDAQLDEIAALESDIQVEVYLDELPEAQSRAVRARVLEGRSYEEIAARENRSPQTVRQRVSRGLAALRPRLKEPPA
jgi:RNA polymerase sigma-70 factor (ECF subfamily)